MPNNRYIVLILVAVTITIGCIAIIVSLSGRVRTTTPCDISQDEWVCFHDKNLGDANQKIVEVEVSISAIEGITSEHLADILGDLSSAKLISINALAPGNDGTTINYPNIIFNGNLSSTGIASDIKRNLEIYPSGISMVRQIMDDSLSDPSKIRISEFTLSAHADRLREWWSLHSDDVKVIILLTENK